jgi:hypothetical protein
VSADSRIGEQHVVVLDWGLGEVAERGGAPAVEEVFADLGLHFEGEPASKLRCVRKVIFVRIELEILCSPSAVVKASVRLYARR